MLALRILIAEDEAHNREALREILSRMGHQVVLAESGKQALEFVANQSFDLILCDIRMPQMDGLEFFKNFKQLYPENFAATAFVFMTAYGRIEDAVAAMREGALHFLTKPLRKKEISALVDEISIRKQAHLARVPSKKSKELFSPIYVSRSFHEVVQLVDKVAGSLASVLFVGESGTGKEILARRLHSQSLRAQAPFVAFNAGAVPEGLMESELFGFEKGAFTGAESARIGQIRSAHGGTFFMDELSSMPLSMQSKLLRVVQEKLVTPLGGTFSVECDVRWVAATNEELEPLVSTGRFREDLLYRLSVVVISIPPLRSRPEDIEVLSNHFLQEFSEREGKALLALLPETLAAMIQYPWPGNVRELRNVIERAVVLADSGKLTLDLLPPHVAQSQRVREIRFAVGTSLQSVEDKLIEETLRSCAGDKARAAAILGVAPRTIYRWLERKALPQVTSTDC